MVEMGVVAAVLGIIVFVVLLPTVYNVVSPTYTLETITNESVTIAGGAGTLAYYPISSITSVSNTTDTFTPVTDYNVTTASTGVMAFGGAIETTPVDVTYRYEPATYLTSSTERGVAQYLFVIVLMGLLVVSSFMALRGG